MIDTFKFGPFVIHIYGIIIAVAIVLGYILAKKKASFYHVPPQFFDSPWLLLPLFFGVLGGRLYHVVDKWYLYIGNPVAVLDVSGGGLGIWGSLAGIFLGFWIVAGRLKINFIKLLDLLAPSVILGQAIGRLGNFVNQEGFGPPTNLPWGVYIDAANRPEQFLSFERFHPTFFYEMVLNLIAFVLLLVFSKFGYRPGKIIALYLIFYGVSRFSTELYRLDTAVFLGVKTAFILSAAAVLSGIIIMAKLRVDKA